MVALFFVVIEFQLTESQNTMATEEANRRQKFNEENGLKSRNRAPSKGKKAYDNHILGAKAEVAVAAYLGATEYLFLDKAPVRNSCDIPGIDIKCRSKHNYDLLVQLDDSLEKIYVLVTIEKDTTRIHGWIPGAEVPLVGIVKEFVPRRPCYAIPQSKLLSMESLKENYQPEKWIAK